MNRSQSSSPPFTTTLILLLLLVWLPACAARVPADGRPTTDPVRFIHEIQGKGSAVTETGVPVTVIAVVVGDFQEADELEGFFIQEEDADADADPLTSEGIFVYCGDCPVAVEEGDQVEVTGIPEEFFGMSQLDVPAAAEGGVRVLSRGLVVTPALLTLPFAGPFDAENTLEAYEGMLVRFAGALTVTEFFQLGRYGQLVLADERQPQHTLNNAPDQTGYAAYRAQLQAARIILDDPNNEQNIDPVYYPQPGGFAVDRYVRGGDTVEDLTAVLHWSFAGTRGTEAWRLRPPKLYPVRFTRSNPRTPPPSVGGSLRVASFNVLNYFNGDGSGGGFPTARGADSPAELARQTAKIVAALTALDADIIGLQELENDYGDGARSAAQHLVDALNTVAGPGAYAYVDPGAARLGDDQIAVGLLYRPAAVRLAPGTTPSVLDTPAELFRGEGSNRAVLAATFEVADAGRDDYGARLTVAVNHFKSKGLSTLGNDGACPGDPNCDQGDGQGNWNRRRTRAAAALTAWLAGDPTGSGEADALIIGDLNAYAMEDPVKTIEAAGYTNLIRQYDAPNTYSIAFDGQWGYLDHALASAALTPQVTGAAIWHINADESSLLDYNDAIRDAGEQSFEAKPSANELYAPDPLRASDHDPVLIGLDLTTSDRLPAVVAAAWEDTNGDGIRQAAEAPLPGVVVQLLDDAGAVLAVDTTAADGAATFARVPTARDLRLAFLPPGDNRHYTLRDQGNDENTDSDADPETGRTAAFRLSSPTTLFRGFDCGFLQSTAVPAPRNGSTGSAGPDFRIYPNPSDDYVLLDLRDFTGRSGTLLLTDPSGRALWSMQLNPITAPTLQLDLRPHASAGGLYHLSLTTAEGRWTKALQLIR